MIRFKDISPQTRSERITEIPFVRSFPITVCSLLFLLLSVYPYSTAEAQINRVEVGDKVRVTAPYVNPMERIKGTISEMSGRVIVLSKEDSLIYISDSLIQTMEVSTGKKRVIGEGLLIGAIAGTVLIGALSAIMNDTCSPSEQNCAMKRSNGDAFLSAGKFGLIAGTAAGAFTGFFVKIDDWERAPVRVGVGISPPSTGIDRNQWVAEPGLSLRIPINM